jgi:hypothetical protein
MLCVRKYLQCSITGWELPVSGLVSQAAGVLKTIDV